jgi:hypothetical protein
MSWQTHAVHNNTLYQLKPVRAQIDELRHHLIPLTLITNIDMVPPHQVRPRPVPTCGRVPSVRVVIDRYHNVQLECDTASTTCFVQVAEARKKFFANLEAMIGDVDGREDVAM